MKPVTQTRTGRVGNCFAACLASIFETPLPELGLAGRDPAYDGNVDKWLAKRGYRYTQVPAEGLAPVGYHTIEGISPRGGMHATVGLNGKMVWDPHPNDGTQHGLKTVERYGLLTPLEGAVAHDLAGKRLNAAAEKLLPKHDEIKANPARLLQGQQRTTYATTHQSIVALVHEADALLSHAKLDEGMEPWRAKLTYAKEALKAAEQAARQGDYATAIIKQEGALSRAHSVIDKMWRSGAKDAQISIDPTDGSLHPDPQFKRQFKRWAQARDSDHYTMRQILDVLKKPS